LKKLRTEMGEKHTKEGKLQTLRVLRGGKMAIWKKKKVPVVKRNSKARKKGNEKSNSIGGGGQWEPKRGESGNAHPVSPDGMKGEIQEGKRL